MEWVKNRTKSNSTVYLEQSHRFNLLTVLNTAALVPKGRVVLKVAAEKWPIVKEYAQKLSLTNIFPAEESDNKNSLYTSS